MTGSGTVGGEDFGVVVRSCERDDVEALYAISLATGHAGGDASHLHRDGRLIGHIYSAPYAVLPMGTVLVAEDAGGVAGYVAGVADTVAWEDTLEADWWPRLRAQYPDPEDVPREARDADQKRAHIIHHPGRTPAAITDHWPAHIHLNLLPRLQRQGMGSRLLAAWWQAVGPEAAHVGVNHANAGGLAFWRAQGFTPLDLDMATGRTIWLGRRKAP